MKKWSVAFLVSFLVATSGCAGLDLLFGKTTAEAKRDLDVNKDGKLDQGEVAKSGLDADKDGKLTDEELLPATEPHAVTNAVLALANAATPFVPQVGVLLGLYTVGKRRKNQVKGLVASIQKIREAAPDRKDLTTAIIQETIPAYTNGAVLFKDVAKWKSEWKNPATPDKA